MRECPSVRAEYVLCSFSVEENPFAVKSFSVDLTRGTLANRSLCHYRISSLHLRTLMVCLCLMTSVISGCYCGHVYVKGPNTLWHTQNIIWSSDLFNMAVILVVSITVCVLSGIFLQSHCRT